MIFRDVLTGRTFELDDHRGQALLELTLRDERIGRRIEVDPEATYMHDTKVIVPGGHDS